MNETVNTVVTAPEEEQTIDLREVFHALLERALWIGAAVVLCLALAFAYTRFLVVPQYESTVTIYAIQGNMSTTGDVTVATYYAEDYAKMIKKRSVLERVIDELDLDMSYERLSSKVSVAIETNSRMLDITVTDEDPVEAQRIADGIANVAKDTMEQMMGVDRATTLSNANLPTAPSSPSLMRNMLIAGAIGLVLSCGAVILFFMMDDKIKSEDQIEHGLGISALGAIPFQAMVEKEKGDA